MAIAAACVGCLLPRTSWCIPSSAKGLEELGSLHMVFAGNSAAKVCRVGLSFTHRHIRNCGFD